MSEKLVWANGCYDVLHPGHIALFSAAKSLAGDGGRLIIGLDSDAKIARDKGPSRPINTFSDRKALLESIKYIDLVLGFDTREELEELIQFYKPDILVDGGDWRDHEGVGRAFAKEVRFFNRVGGYSSSDIIRRCANACE
jgi:D-beta-D-heptose 7-phosphate kinase/D-beta-D-heptose 1-phosphate adenosyltransferase